MHDNLMNSEKAQSGSWSGIFRRFVVLQAEKLGSSAYTNHGLVTHVVMKYVITITSLLDSKIISSFHF